MNDVYMQISESVVLFFLGYPFLFSLFNLNRLKFLFKFFPWMDSRLPSLKGHINLYLSYYFLLSRVKYCLVSVLFCLLFNDSYICIFDPGFIIFIFKRVCWIEVTLPLLEQDFVLLFLNFKYMVYIFICMYISQ